MTGGTSGRRPLRELADAVGMVTGWNSLVGGGAGGDDDAGPQPRGPGVLAVQSVIMIGVAAVLCFAKIVFYGNSAAGWLAVLVPLAVPVALATTHRPPRLALGLSTAGLAAAVAGLLAVVLCHDYVGGFWLGFLGLSVASLVAATVFGFVTAAPWRPLA
ncbi:MAG: hypothetical protein ACRDSR_20905 [Pseudonocardiaceae bacterium]